MYIYIFIALSLVSCSTAKPGIVSSLSYNTPLYASAGTSQVDVRNNYNSGYSTSLGYASPLANRVAASVNPFAYLSSLARYNSPAIAAPYGFTAPVARYTSPLAAAYANPFAASYAATLPAPYTPYSAYGAPYTLAVPASAPVLL